MKPFLRPSALLVVVLYLPTWVAASVVVTPSTVTLASGATHKFTANHGVNWSVTAGNITSTGLFTAPVVTSQTTVTVKAKAVQSRSFGTATVIVMPKVPDQHTVDLKWDLSLTPDVISYSLYRGAVGNSLALVASAISGTTYVDNSVVSGQTYFYAATAVNIHGESVDSNEIIVVIP
jgi:hypothetical protein